MVVTIWRTTSLYLVFLSYLAQRTLYRSRKVCLACVWCTFCLSFWMVFCAIQENSFIVWEFSSSWFALNLRISLFSGLVTNIPANMVVDQFGMIGLLTFIRAGNLSLLFPWPTLLPQTQHLQIVQLSLSYSTLPSTAETDPNLVSLALGADLTTLGLNLNSEVGITNSSPLEKEHKQIVLDKNIYILVLSCHC